MFSRKTRKGLLGGVALALAGLMAGEAGAANGVLITPSFCESPSNVRDIVWGNQNWQANNIYYMKSDGSIITLHGTTPPEQLNNLLITSHGSCGKIAKWSNREFTSYLFEGLKKKDNFDRIALTSCGAADGEPSLLKLLAGEFKQTPILGWSGRVSLAGNGSRDLSQAVFTTDATTKGRFINQKTALLFNIDKYWNELIVPTSMGRLSLMASCKLLTKNDDIHTDAVLRSGLQDIISISLKIFFQEASNVIPSHSINDLVEMSDGNVPPKFCKFNSNTGLVDCGVTPRQ